MKILDHLLNCCQGFSTGDRAVGAFTDHSPVLALRLRTSRAMFAFSHIPLYGEMAQFYRYLCNIEEHDLMFQLSVTRDATQFDINNLFFQVSSDMVR
jgi:hypothetical protein